MPSLQQSAKPEKRSGHAPAGVLWGTVLAAAIVLRFAVLGAHPLWYDEAARLITARDHLWRCLAFDGFAGEPFLLLLLAGWQQIGTGDLWLRVHAALAGTLSVGAAAWLGGLLGGKRGAFGAALFTALSPALVFYSRDANMYALAILWSLLLAAAAVAFAQGKRPKTTLVVYCACAFLLLHTHLMSPLFLTVFNAAFLFLLAAMRRWRAIGAWLLANAAVVVLSLPLALGLLRLSHSMQGMSHWAPSPSPERLFYALRNLAAAYTPAGHAALALGVGVLALAAWACLGCKPHRRYGFFLAAVAILTVAGFYGASLSGPRSYFVARYFLQTAALFYVLAGVGWALLRPAALRAGVLIAMAVPLAPALQAVYTLDLSPQWNAHPGVFSRPNARAMAAMLDETAPAAPVFHTSPQLQMLMRWYAPGHAHHLIETGILASGDPKSIESVIWSTPLPLETLREQKHPYVLALPLQLPHLYAESKRIALFAQTQHPVRLAAGFGHPYAPSRLCCLDPRPEAATRYPPTGVLRPDLPASGFIQHLPEGVEAAWIPGPGNALALRFRNRTEHTVQLMGRLSAGPAGAAAFAMTRSNPDNSRWRLRTLRAGQGVRPSWYRTVGPDSGQRDALEAALHVTAGTWWVWAEVITQGKAFPSAAARFHVHASGQSMPHASEPSGEGGWQWRRYGPFTVDRAGPAPLTFEAHCPPGEAEAHAALAQVVAVASIAGAGPPASSFGLDVAPGRTTVRSLHPAAPPLYALVWAGDDFVLLGPPEKDAAP